jgi:sterol desaturase/sphingolipid hydroxylase (fatty acid hydroxylase superfamily)
MHLVHAGLSPAAGHSGFDEVELKAGKTVLPNHNLFHYLHHRYFECNYGGDGSVPIDRWFGSFHNGSREAHTRMRARTHSRMRTRTQARTA